MATGATINKIHKKMRKSYTEKEIMEKFKKLSPPKKVKILEKALSLSLQNRAGTREYAIANSMGYGYQDDGSYIYCGKE